MPYERQGFENGQVLEDKHMIAIEDGILELQQDLEEIDTIEESEILGICK